MNLQDQRLREQIISIKIGQIIFFLGMYHFILHLFNLSRQIALTG